MPVYYPVVVSCSGVNASPIVGAVVDLASHPANSTPRMTRVMPLGHSDGTYGAYCRAFVGPLSTRFARWSWVGPALHWHDHSGMAAT